MLPDIPYMYDLWQDEQDALSDDLDQDWLQKHLSAYYTRYERKLGRELTQSEKDRLDTIYFTRPPEDSPFHKRQGLYWDNWTNDYTDIPF